MTQKILKQILNNLQSVSKQLDLIASKYESAINHYLQEIKVLSWDCGMKTTSWSYLSITHFGAIKIISQGTIDFLDGCKIRSVSANEWPSRIHKGLTKYAPVVTDDTIVVIENQMSRHKGLINSANCATQYSIGLWYHKNKIMFLNATHKNKIGPVSIQKVAEDHKIDGEQLRKKHTRINYELFVNTFYGDDRSFIVTETQKKRDLSDSFAQGVYVLNKLRNDTLMKKKSYFHKW